MLIDLYADERQYLDHLEPIWLGLPPEHRGRAWVSGRIWEYARSRGIEAIMCQPRPERGGLALVAAATNANLMARRGARIIFVEHGAGQTYPGCPEMVQDVHYSGGAGRDWAALFLCPSAEVAERNRARYPDVPSVAVGSAKLDALARIRAEGAQWRTQNPPQVALAFHWKCRGCTCPEMHWAADDYLPHIPALRETFCLLGHGHPRYWSWFERTWRRAGIEPVAHFADVVRRASVYVADNTSSAIEAAALGIPIVWLNARRWRRDVEHGGRFWSWSEAGIGVDEPSQLADAITCALNEPPNVQDARRRITDALYAVPPGQATAASVEAILACLRPRQETS